MILRFIGQLGHFWTTLHNKMIYLQLTPGWLKTVSEILNADKCCYKIMLFSRKRLNSSPPSPLHIDGCELSMVKQTKHLGILLSREMSWTTNISAVCAKASWSTVSQILHVQPHLKYCACVWDPYLVKDVHQLESVQKFALKVCCKQCSSSYQDLLELSKLSSLQTRREAARLAYICASLSTTTLFFLMHPFSTGLLVHTVAETETH